MIKNVMTTKFRSISNGQGDSFIIQDNERNYLFDSGQSYRRIKKSIPKKIDIAICSHNDNDHSSGFVGLLNDWNKEIAELWLPGYWLPIILFCKDLNEDISSIQWSDSLNIGEKFDQYLKNISIQNSGELLDNFDVETTKDIYEDLAFLADYNADFPSYLSYYYPFHDQLFSKLLSKIHFETKNLIKIVKLAYERECRIKWFYPTNKEVHSKPLSEGFLPLNSNEACSIKKIKNNDFICFLSLIQLSRENKYSIVFEYYKKDKPIILLTADNDLSFIDTPKNYNNEIIITAPHHGSDSCNAAYLKIRADKIIWVRSWGPRNRNAGITLINDMKTGNNEGYCDFCIDYNDGNKKIDLQLINNSWKCIKGRKCICRYCR